MRRSGLVMGALVATPLLGFILMVMVGWAIRRTAGDRPQAEEHVVDCLMAILEPFLPPCPPPG